MCNFFVIFKQTCFLNNGQSKADTYTELLHFKPTFMIDYRSYSKYSLQIPHPYRYNDVALQGSGELYPYFAAEAFVFILLPEFIIKAITEWGEGRNQREGYRNLVPRVFKTSTFVSNARRGPFSPVYVINDKQTSFQLYSTIKKMLSNVIKYSIFSGRSDTQPIFVQPIHQLKKKIFFVITLSMR